ncbi:MAG: serine hydrolase [Anaerolineales bacterium]
MLNRGRFNLLFIFAAVCLVASAALFLFELYRYSQTFARMPAGLSLGGVPVGGLSETDALQQLITTYNAPVELRYRDEVILLDPPVVGFEVNAAVMLPQVTQFRNTSGFWSGLWDYLWLQIAPVRDVPLRAQYSQDRLRAFLADLAARYDEPGNPPTADPNTLGFEPGEPGHTLNTEAAVELINRALYSPRERTVTLPVAEQTIVQPTYQTLAELLKQNLQQYQFDGVASIFLSDLNTGDELTFSLSNGEPVTGPVAYSAMSIIKVPIMTSLFARRSGELTQEDDLLLQRSLEESQNTATDFLLKTIGRNDGFEGTRQMTNDMRRLGLVNTYLSGLLDVQGAVLSPYATPANGRADVSTNPDPYNQTTADDMGTLLVMLYQCSKGGGTLPAAFPGEFTPQECQLMIDLLSQNKLGPSLIAGGSPGGFVAHKHGWDTVPLTNIADAALVFTPGGDYALVIYMHRPQTIGFPEANRIVISLAQAVYNFYNGQ